MLYPVEQLLSGLESAEFVPYFQPIVDLRSGSIYGFEILARWEHPRHGLIPPSVFIPLLEQHRLINNLSATLLVQTFAAARRLPSDFNFSVNLSPSQLHDRTLPEFIENMAGEAEFDLRRLSIELTETALVDDIDLALAVATDFKRLGIRLALDDFGTGYSSLLHLQALPFDELKLDSSFVRSMVQLRQSRKITAAVISLGLSLGLQTVAEGIEEQSQANLLVWQGCQFGQGYLYGRPVPAAELPASRPRSYASNCLAPEVPAIADPFLELDAHPAERLSQLRAIYDGAPVGLAFLSTTLRYINLNQRLAQFNGRPLHDHLGREVSEVIAPELYAQFEPYLKRALQGESFAGIELRRPPGSPSVPEQYLMASYQPVRDEAGEILGICVSVTDISGVKQKEEALRESEDHYRNMVELNPQIPWVADADGSIISVSSRWEKVTGLTLETTKDHGWLKVVHPEDLRHVTETVNRSVNSGELFDVEYRILAQDRWIWLRSRGSPHRDSEGKIVRWYGSVEIVEEHKRTMEQMRMSEARLSGIFDAVPVGIVLVDGASGQVLQANPRAEQLLGFHLTPGLVWSSLPWVAYDSSGRRLDDTERPLLRALRRQESTYEAEVLLYPCDGGAPIWLSFTAKPVCLENGAQLGGVLVIQEIDVEKGKKTQATELSVPSTLSVSTSL